MQLQHSIWLFHAILATGLATWLTLATLNNLHAFHGAVWAIGNTMRMDPLRQDPTIQTPLLRRALTSLTLHRLSLGVVLALQLLAASAAWTGLALFLGGGIGRMGVRPRVERGTGDGQGEGQRGGADDFRMHDEVLYSGEEGAQRRLIRSAAR